MPSGNQLRSGGRAAGKRCKSSSMSLLTRGVPHRPAPTQTVSLTSGTGNPPFGTPTYTCEQQREQYGTLTHMQLVMVCCGNPDALQSHHVLLGTHLSDPQGLFLATAPTPRSPRLTSRSRRGRAHVSTGPATQWILPLAACCAEQPGGACSRRACVISPVGCTKGACGLALADILPRDASRSAPFPALQWWTRSTHQVRMSA